MKQLALLLTAAVLLGSCQENKDDGDKYKTYKEVNSPDKDNKITHTEHTTYTDIYINNDGTVAINDSTYSKTISDYDEQGRLIISKAYANGEEKWVEEYNYVNNHDYKYQRYFVDNGGTRNQVWFGTYIFKDDNTTVEERYPGKYFLDMDVNMALDFTRDTVVTTLVYRPETQTYTQTSETHNGHPINDRTGFFIIKKKETLGDTSISYTKSIEIANNDTVMNDDCKSMSIVLAKNSVGDATKSLNITTCNDSVVYKSLVITEIKYSK